MKLLKLLILLLFFIGCKSNETKKINEALNCTQNWFKAWELVSNEVFKLEKKSPARFVFFDSTYVYTTSPLTGQGGKEIVGPQLFDEKQVWYKKEHKGFLVLCYQEVQ